MKVQVQCFSIKIAPYSVKPESHIVTVPNPGKLSLESERDDFEDEEAREQQGAYEFLRKALAEYLPPNLELESRCPCSETMKAFSSLVPMPIPTHIITSS